MRKICAGIVLKSFFAVSSFGVVVGQTSSKDCDTVKASLDNISVGSKMDGMDFSQLQSSEMPRLEEFVMKLVFSGCFMEIHIDASTSLVRSTEFHRTESLNTVKQPEKAPAPATSEDKPAWLTKVAWKLGTVTDITQATSQQKGWLTGDTNTIETWTYTIKTSEGTYLVRDEITRGLMTGHPPLTRDEGKTFFCHRDGDFLSVVIGVRGKGKNEKPVMSNLVITKFTPN